MSAKTYYASDRIAVTSRAVTDEGFMVVPGTLARTGVQEYRAYELGLDANGADPMKVIRLHRPESEVFNKDSLASFESKPVTIDHPPEAVTSANWKQYAVGDVRNIVRSGDFMAGTITLKDADAIAAMQSGKAELSNGYSFELDMTPGTVNGQAYDGIQKNIRGNHVALVDAARCGPACRIADSHFQLNPKGNTMADAKRKVTVDGFSLEVDDTAANAIDTLVKQRDEARTELTDAKTKALEADKLKVALDQANAEIEALKKDVMTPEQRDAMVADWSKMISDAKRLLPDLVTDGKTCLAIRREAIVAVTAKDTVAKAVADAVLAGKPIESADADTVRAAFQAIAAAVKVDASDAAGMNATDAAVAAALLGDTANKQAKTELVGRDAFVARQKNAWMNKPGQQ